MKSRNIFFVIVILLSSTIFIGWGNVGHQIINKNSTLSFPRQMQSFLIWADSLAAHASDADYRKSSDTTEAPKHYIDIDNYPEFILTGYIPQNFDSLVALHGYSFVLQQGVLPWTILAMVDSLQTAFANKQWQRALLIAADLGHYVADAHMPLHITRNFNGQFTNQFGIHGRYESGMINRHSTQIIYEAQSVEYVSDLTDYVFTFIYKNYNFVESVLFADSLATAITGNNISEIYYTKLWLISQSFTIPLFENASNNLAALIYTAWINAGSPSPETDIYTVQQDTTLVGQHVTATGIVTAATGVFNPGRTFIEEQNGGPWSGILLWDSTETFFANAGDEVRVTGEVYEFFGMTEILVNNYDILSTGNSLPEVELVNTGDIAPGSITAESYEGVLVQVQNITVIDDNLGYGEWLVDDGSGACRIDDDADNLSYEIPAIGTSLSSITGVLNYSHGNFKLEPRYRTDIIDSAPIPIGDTLTIVQRPLPNIPAIILPGDTLDILCDFSNQLSSWSASLIHKSRKVDLIPIGQDFNEDKELWILKAILPESVFYELYDLKLEIHGSNSDVVKNAVHVIPQFNENFYFVHVTDTHLPTHLYWFQEGSEQDTSEVEDLRQVIRDINLINPAFVLLTGDFINEGELEDFLNLRYYTRAQNILSEFEVPVFLVAGNHDIGGWLDTPMPNGTARRDWWRFFGWQHLDDPPGENPKYTQDYTFNYGNGHFIGMESYYNYDLWRSEIYGDKSFTDEQLVWLQNDLNSVGNSFLKVLFYHYDFSNQLVLENLGVDLALWGHTHQDSGSIYNHPFNLCTESSSDGNRAYRLIRIQGNSIIPTHTLHAGSNGENIQIEYVSDSLSTTATITNRTDESFENTLIKFTISPGVNLNVENGTLFQVDSLSSPWIVYVQTSVPTQTTKQIVIHYLIDGIDDLESLPYLFQLEQNYPNPFNPTTTIKYSISQPSHVTIKVFDLLGRETAVLVNELKMNGEYNIEFDASGLASGVYVYRMKAGNFSKWRKFVLLR